LLLPRARPAAPAPRRRAHPHRGSTRMKSLLLATALAATAAPQAPIDLRSETLVVEHDKRRATFGGGVTATRGDLRLQCPEVIATYGADSQVREVACQGPVEALQGARRMNAQSGVFDNATGL